MEVKLAEHLMIESEIPLLKVESFVLCWKLNDHAYLQIIGMADEAIPCNWEKIYNSKIKLWRRKENDDEILFHGYLKSVEMATVGRTKQICLNVESGSCKLDIQKQSRSFQDISKTYSEIEKQIIEETGGLVICTEGKELKIEQPVICYQETAWEFSKRMASYVKTCIVADIESGKSALWFGLPKGKQTPCFPETEYGIRVENDAKMGTSVSYEVEGREFYKIGAQTAFLDQKVTITEVVGRYEHGELIFTYLLKGQRPISPVTSSDKFRGLGIKGEVLDVQRETMSVALDIDNGKSTGSYYYNWYPETGNSLYSMPEKGARVVLYFGDANVREGFIIHCVPNRDEKLDYADRCLELENGGTIALYDDALGFSRKKGHRISVGDGAIILGTTKQIRISAEEKIKIKAKTISIKADTEVKIYQG